MKFIMCGAVLAASLIACVNAIIWTEELSKQAVENTRHIWAPEIKSVGEAVSLDSNRPTVVVHGMGDAGTNDGMQSLCKTVTAKYPGTFVLCSNTANGFSSITTKMADQLSEFVTEIGANSELAQGFNAVGLSQGNFLIEAYIALVNDPPVYNFVSICGPLEGEALCPDTMAFDLICPIWKLDPYGAALAFSGYWKGTDDKANYLAKSQLLADVLNERDTKNATVTKHFESLNSLMMIQATQDTMIVPKESEQHGMWQWGTTGDGSPIVMIQDSEGYQGDWIALQTLDKAGKLRNSTFEGAHIQFTDEYWDTVVLPFLNTPR